MINGQVGEWLPLTEASERLGITLDTIRKKVKKGDFQARKVPGQKGFRWEVYLVSDQASAEPEDQACPEPAEMMELETSLEPSLKASDLVPLLQQLQSENHQLTQQNIQLAGQLGFLQAQLEAAKAEILSLQAPPPPEATEADQPQNLDTKPWWMFWK